MVPSIDELQPFLSTCTELLSLSNAYDAAELLSTADVRLEETGYDNWNGGTRIFTVYLAVSTADYVRLDGRREQIEEQINNRLKTVLEVHTSDWYSIKVIPSVKSEHKKFGSDISQETRKNILDGLRLEKINWNGQLEEVEFLQRIYDLNTIPSHDSRFKDAAGDIWQHRVNNDDWSYDWIYGDARFNLMGCSTNEFLRFLCEIVHPVVRPDRNESIKLVQHFNDQLKCEGWQIIEQEKIAGRPRFVALPLSQVNNRSVSRARTVADALDAGWMQKEIERLENAVDKDPALAIGTAKELVESCCKSILTKLEIPYSRSADLPELTKCLTKELKLVPENISEEAKGVDKIRLILRNLSSLTQYLAELRGLYGSGHGRDGKHRGLEPRHARLAVGAAVVFIDFVTDTYRQRLIKKEEEKA
jgi:hypothetical protein